METRRRGPAISLQPFDQGVVDFNCPDLARLLEQAAGEKTQSWADLDNLIVSVQVEQAENRFDHSLVNKKVLPPALFKPKRRLAQCRAHLFMQCGHPCSTLNLTLECI